MPRSPRSTSKQLALLAGMAAGIAVGASALAGPAIQNGLHSVDDTLVQGMTGSNARGMTGSNARGMTGSNARGMTGSNARGMTGSNARGMTGSNARGMTGSNARGMTGSNARGMTGSNARGMTGSNARGMTGSNARGMTGSNARGMTGSNARGMTGSNARGMTGSNARGMTGSNARGMTGSNARGMTGSNARGMTGSNARGMTGSNARGMTGSNARGITGSNGRVVSAQDTSHFGSGFSVAAMGVLEAISVEKGTARLVVAGQTFGVPAGEALSLSVGDYVVAGAASGAMAVVYATGLPYVAGLSAVRVKATVDSVDAAMGNLTVGGLTVDYTSQLSLNPTVAPTAGDVVEVAGVQPLSRGTLLVSSSGDGLTVAPAAPTAFAGRQ